MNAVVGNAVLQTTIHLGALQRSNMAQIDTPKPTKNKSLFWRSRNEARRPCSPPWGIGVSLRPPPRLLLYMLIIYQSEGGGTPNGVMKLPGRVMAGGVVPAGGFFLFSFTFFFCAAASDPPATHPASSASIQMIITRQS